MKFWRHVLILLLSLLIFPTEGRHQHGNRQSSSGNPPNRGDKESKVVKLSPEILMPDPTTIDKLPECQRICNGAFSNAIRAALEASNHRDRFVDVCRHFNESISCHDKLEDCPGRSAFDMLTSGLYYACIDQRRAFDKVINCLDEKSNEVQSGCENQCKGQTRLSEWASKVKVFNMFGRADKPLQGLELDNFRLMIHDFCELATCYLACFRSSFDKNCGNNAGTLLSEAVVRPVAETQADPFVKSVSSLMYVFVPQQCSFFVREDALANHRIDPKLDENLRKQTEEDENLLVQNSTTAASADSTANFTQSTDINQTSQQVPKPRNMTAIVGDMSEFDPIDLAEKWGLDIGDTGDMT